MGDIVKTGEIINLSNANFNDKAFYQLPFVTRYGSTIIVRETDSLNVLQKLSCSVMHPDDIESEHAFIIGVNFIPFHTHAFLHTDYWNF